MLTGLGAVSPRMNNKPTDNKTHPSRRLGLKKVVFLRDTAPGIVGLLPIEEQATCSYFALKYLLLEYLLFSMIRRAFDYLESSVNLFRQKNRSEFMCHRHLLKEIFLKISSASIKPSGGPIAKCISFWSRPHFWTF